MRTPNNIEKPIPGRGDNEATKEILLAVDKEKLEFDAMNDILDTLMEEFKKEAKPDTSFLDWLKSKDKDYLQKYYKSLMQCGSNFGSDQALKLVIHLLTGLMKILVQYCDFVAQIINQITQDLIKKTGSDKE